MAAILGIIFESCEARILSERLVVALSGHSATAVKSPFFGSKADIDQLLLANLDL